MSKLEIMQNQMGGYRNFTQHNSLGTSSLPKLKASNSEASKVYNSTKYSVKSIRNREFGE